MLRCQMFDLSVLTRRSRAAPPPKGALPKGAPSIYGQRRNTMGSRLSAVNLDINVDDVLLKNLQDEYPDSFWEFTREPAEKVAPLSALTLPTAAQIAAAASAATASSAPPPPA